MPQEHYVLKCFSCETFQAHIVKKLKKWECKICGIKQSLKRNYGKGSGKDCRIQVMRLNELRLTKNSSLIPVKSKIFNESFIEDLNDQEIKEHLQVEKPLSSKWAKYLEENTVDKESESDDCTTDFSLDSDGKKKKRMKKKLENCYLKKRKTYSESNESKMFSQACEEKVKKSDIHPSSSNQRFDSYKKKEQEIKSNCLNQYKNKLKVSKYTNYLEEDKNENNLTVIKKMANIFDSNTNDLDSLLKF